MASTQAKLLGPDGLVRAPVEERKLNELAASTFSSNGAREFLAYLRSITIEAVAGPHIGSDELRHREGMRYLVAIIEQRINKGKQNV